MRYVCVSLLLAASLILSPSFSYAVQESEPLTTDGRIKTFLYVPDEVYSFTGHYRYQSTIVLEAGENIATITMGDSTGWMIKDSGNRIFLKPVDPDAVTNMTVITNKRTYLFELHAEEAEDIRDTGISFITRFRYPNSEDLTIASPGNSNSFVSKKEEDSAPKIFEKPELYNFNYTFNGSELIAPLKVFDDGQFTFIEFKNVNAPLPAVFKVNKNGDESIINYRVANGYVVIEEVSSMFTLRYGEEVACIFNEVRPLKREDI